MGLETSTSMARFCAGNDEPEISTADRIANKRPRLSASSSQSPIHLWPEIQPMQPQSRGRRSCAVEEEENFIPVEVVESDEEEFAAEDDGDDAGAGSENDGEDEGPAEQVTRSTPAPSQLRQLHSGGGSRRCNTAFNNSSGEIPVVLMDPGVLDCPICLDPLSTPIYQCVNGHVTCSTCISTSRRRCPSCSSPMGTNRCRAMEKLLESLQINCKNASFGCKQTLIFNKKTEHQKTCPYAPCFCPHPSCTFTGSANSLYLHFHSHHAAAATSFAYNTNFYVTIKTTQNHIFLRERQEGVIFILNHDIQGNNRVFKIDCVGSSPFKNGFLYKVKVRCEETCLSMKSEAKVYVKWQQNVLMKNCLRIPLDFLGQNGLILVKICIKKARSVA